MASGYTHCIEERDDVTFREFILSCSRAFGACIMQRDDPHGDPPKARTVNSYYLDRIKETEAEIAALKAKTPEQLLRQQAADSKRHEADRKASLIKIRRANERYSRMIGQVEAWTPPTTDHQGLKAFMLEQIRASMYSEDYYKRKQQEDPEIILDAETYRAEQLKLLEETIAYSKKSHAAEVKVAEESARWVEALYASLK